MDLVDFIITVYVMVDDFYKQTIKPRELRTRGRMPKLADSEVLTMELVGEFLGLHNDKDIYLYFRRHWMNLFPNMPDRTNFVRQCANLWKIKELLFMSLTRGQDHSLQIIDSIPIKVCAFARARSSRLFKGSAAYGKWWGQTFFGYRIHLKITHTGMIRTCILTPANIHDIHFAEQLFSGDVHGWGIGDKGYRSHRLHKRLWDQHRLYFHTSVRRVDRKTSLLPKTLIRRLSGIRRLIETVAAQLTEQFSIKATTARDFWHLSNRILRKIVSHTVGVYLNVCLSRDPLKLKSLVC